MNDNEYDAFKLLKQFFPDFSWSDETTKRGGHPDFLGTRTRELELPDGQKLVIKKNFPRKPEYVCSEFWEDALCKSQMAEYTLGAHRPPPTILVEDYMWVEVKNVRSTFYTRRAVLAETQLNWFSSQRKAVQERCFVLEHDRFASRLYPMANYCSYSGWRIDESQCRILTDKQRPLIEEHQKYFNLFKEVGLCL